jgi:hypothetical protein
MTLDGLARRWPTTWMASWASVVTYAHETGHALGLPHSSGPYGKTYDSRWDVMSTGYSFDAALKEYVAPHTIAYHKDLLGWIPAGRKYLAAVGTSASFELARAALPGSDGYEMAQIPIAGSSAFYTLEARRYAGYDAVGRLPAEGVVIHRVNPADHIPAKVVDVDGNGNPNDAGATWVPGEAFIDEAGGVQVRVLAATGGGYRVEVSTGGTLPVAWVPELAPAVMGAAYDGPLAPALAGASWSVVGGALPRGVTLSAEGRLTGVPAEAGSFAFTVSVVQPGGFTTHALRLEVTTPRLAESNVLDQLLGGAGLTADESRYLDLQGNANGRLDVGDVRAWVQAQAQVP